MQSNPFIESIPYRIGGILFLLVVLSVHASLLVLYGQTDWTVALADGAVYVGLLGISGFLMWNVAGILKAVQTRIALAFLIMIVCIAGCFVFQSLFMEVSSRWFVETLPLRLVYSLPCWVILVQWYKIDQLKSDPDYTIVPEESCVVAEETAPAATASEEETLLDRITVKDGTRIHIIQLDELLYIQASGDYVTFFTPSGQFIKEQTMKYFEMHLPPDRFVRIHRSCIINTEQIMRIELFGKESYQVRLKNGASLRASSAGYKLLKERLCL